MTSLHVLDHRRGWMPNERLRAALLEHGLTPPDLGERLGVDHKTVERWIAGRTPYRKYRYAVATAFGQDERYFWPDALPRDQVLAASDSEVLAIYPHRSDVPPQAWERLFAQAQRDIGVLVYSGLFLSGAAAARTVLADRARAGVRVRILLGDPDSALRTVAGLEFRFHQTILYNSIYIGDDQLLVNTHVLGVPAARAPVWHLKKVAGGEIVSMYQESFERVWETATPVPGLGT